MRLDALLKPSLVFYWCFVMVLKWFIFYKTLQNVYFQILCMCTWLRAPKGIEGVRFPGAGLAGVVNHPARVLETKQCVLLPAESCHWYAFSRMVSCSQSWPWISDSPKFWNCRPEPPYWLFRHCRLWSKCLCHSQLKSTPQCGGPRARGFWEAISQERPEP